MASQSSKWMWATLVAVLAAAVVIVVVALRPDDSPQITPPAAVAGTDAVPLDASGELTFDRLSRPARTQVKDADGRVLAVFTDGARTVRISGPERTFGEARFTHATVTTEAWIRLAPKPWWALTSFGQGVSTVGRRRVGSWARRSAPLLLILR